MKTLIRKPNEIVINPTIQMLIYGQAGTGKTTLALSAPKPLLLDFDGGVSRVNAGHQCDTVQITSYQDAIDVLQEDLSEYQSIVIDTAGKLLDYMAAWLIASNGKLGKTNGALSLQGFGERKAEFRNFCRQIRSLNKHLVFVAHRETQKNGDEIRYVPIFGGSSYDDLVTELDLVGYIETIGRKRVITFDPTDRNDGKNTIYMPPVNELPVTVDEQGIAQPNTYISDNIIAAFVRRIEAQKELNEDFATIMECIDGIIEGVQDADTANEACEKIINLQHVGNSKLMGALKLNEKTKYLGLKLNKEAGRYE